MSSFRFYSTSASLNSSSSISMITLSFSLKISLISGPSIFSSNTNSNLFSGQSSLTTCLRYEKCSGGGNIGSTTNLRAFSSIDGISLAKRGDDSSKQGLVFTSIRKTLKFSSIMKSSPYTSKVLILLFGSILPQVALIQSVDNFLIYGRMSLSNWTLREPWFLSR